MAAAPGCRSPRRHDVEPRIHVAGATAIRVFIKSSAKIKQRPTLGALRALSSRNGWVPAQAPEPSRAAHNPRRQTPAAPRQLRRPRHLTITGQT